MAEPRRAGCRFIYHTEHFLVQGLVEGLDGGKTPETESCSARPQSCDLAGSFSRSRCSTALGITTLSCLLGNSALSHWSILRLSILIAIHCRWCSRDVVVLFALDPAHSCLPRADRQDVTVQQFQYDVVNSEDQPLLTPGIKTTITAERECLIASWLRLL